MRRRAALAFAFSALAMLGPRVAFAQGAAPPSARDAQTPQPAGTGMIAGVVAVADSGRPVRQARVILTGGDPRTVKSAVTDDQGRFVFEQLAGGAYSLSATRPGYLEVVHGQRRPGSGRPGTPIQLAAGQKLDRLTLTIPRGGVLTGQVLDDVGDPSFGAQVRALRYVLRTGVRTLEPAGTGATDDRGIYRIPALLPGEYVVVVTPRESGLMASEEMKARELLLVAAVSKLAAAGDASAQARDAAIRDAMAGTTPAPDAPIYAAVYYPGTTQARSATSIPLDVSEERSGVDLRLQLVPTVTVTGQVTADGAIPQGAQVQLIDLDSSVPGMSVRSARMQADGRFTFSAVPPGRYTVSARATQMTPEGPASPAMAAAMSDSLDKMRAMAAAGANVGDPRTTDTLWAMADVVIGGGPPPPVMLSLQRGMAVSGSVAFDNVAAPADLTRVRVMVTHAADGGGTIQAPTREAPVDATGRFTIRGVVPGRYRVSASGGLPPGSVLESAAFGGRDALDFFLEVRPGEDQASGVLTFAPRLSELTGLVHDATGKPAADYTLIVFSADSRYWLPSTRRIQATRPATDGRFSWNSLPAGDYRLVAVVDPDPGQWFDPAFLRDLLPASMAVTLARGEKRTQDVRTGAR